MAGENPIKLMEQLGVDRDSYRVMALLPMVYVAWADGTMQRAERSVILNVAREKGWLAGDGEKILGRWLAEPPSAEQIDVGMRALRALVERTRGVGASLHEDTLVALMADCRDVAKAAGGAWGLVTGDVQQREADALREVAEALFIDDGRTWQQLADAGAVDPGLPPGPRGRLLLGNAIEFLRAPLTLLSRCQRDYGDVYALRMGRQDAVTVLRPEHVQHVLVDNADNYVRPPGIQVMAKLVGDSMFTADGERWRRLRRIAQPAFRKSALEALVPEIARITEQTLDSWQGYADSGEPVDVAEQMSTLTLRVIGQVLFSVDLLGEAAVSSPPPGGSAAAVNAAALGDAVADALEYLSRNLLNPLRLPLALPTADNQRFKRAMGVFDDLIYAMIEKRRAAEAAGGGEGDDAAPSDLLGLLLAARDEETGERLSDEELRNELLTLLTAGHETTAVALTFTFYLLSRHPVVARELLARIGAAVGDAAPTAEDLDKLEYVDWVVMEAMRLYPPIHSMARQAIAEDEIAGYRIPKGTVVAVAQWSTHHHPEVWDNPEGFDPERFSPERSEGRHKLAWFPFGAGPRKCIGYALTMLEVEVIVPMILSRYRLDLQPCYQLELDALLTIRPRGGLPMTIRPRAK